ncbi:MAG: hypothetical protein AAF514_08060, partial [Verrucomicrobiota bacterium]
DLDRDGDLDLIHTNFDEAVSLYRNNENENNGLLLRLIGTSANRWGLGAIVKAETASGNQTRQLSLSRGFMSANEPLHRSWCG